MSELKSLEIKIDEKLREQYAGYFSDPIEFQLEVSLILSVQSSILREFRKAWNTRQPDPEIKRFYDSFPEDDGAGSINDYIGLIEEINARNTGNELSAYCMLALKLIKEHVERNQ